MQDIIPAGWSALAQVAQIADQAAAAHSLDTYHQGLSPETRRRHKHDLELFARFLQETVQASPGDFYTDLEAWRDISYGLAAAFKIWQEQLGYALGSIGVRLSTVKAYCKLAHDAGVISTEAYTRIQGVKGYRGMQARNVDAERPVKRIGNKKAQWVEISPAHAQLLKRAPAGPLADRDRLLLCLLLDHALRIGEAAILKTSAINLREAKITYLRPKVSVDPQTDELTPDTLDAARRYLATIPPGQQRLFEGLTTRAMAMRVTKLARSIGIDGFSPHDCRHYFAEDALRNGTDLKTLMDAGGWKTLEMPARYAGRQKIANKGLRLSAIPNL